MHHLSDLMSEFSRLWEQDCKSFAVLGVKCPSFDESMKLVLKMNLKIFTKGCFVFLKF